MAALPRRALVVLGLLCFHGLSPSNGVAAQQVRVDALPVSGPRLVVTTSDDGTTGAVVELSGADSSLVDALAPTDGARFLRRFGQQLFVVNRVAATIRRVPLNFGPSQLYSLEAGSQPMDVLVAGAPVAAPGFAWVTRRNDPFLHRLDLASGAGEDVIDLSPVGGGRTISLGTMVRHGTRLFVQVRVAAAREAEIPWGDTGVLAVVDLLSEQLIDVDRRAPGIQGVALLGAPPRYKMQILDGMLYVSTTESFNDVRGGIEMVDPGTLVSVGFAISEAGGHSDMGGFVMLDAERGYYVFHTDLLLSTHLVSFTVSGGPAPGGMIDLLHDAVDYLVHDPGRRLLYLPSGFSSNAPGLYAFSTDTNQLVGPPIATGLRPHDALLVEALLPIEP